MINIKYLVAGAIVGMVFMLIFLLMGTLGIAIVWSYMHSQYILLAAACGSFFVMLGVLIKCLD